MAEFPTTMPLWLEEILGSPPWRTAQIYRALRSCGQEIKHHYEEETAAAVFFMISLGLEFGPDWWTVAVDRINERLTFMGHVRAMAQIVLEALDG